MRHTHLSEDDNTFLGGTQEKRGEKGPRTTLLVKKKAGPWYKQRKTGTSNVDGRRRSQPRGVVSEERAQLPKPQKQKIYQAHVGTKVV